MNLSPTIRSVKYSIADIHAELHHSRMAREISRAKANELVAADVNREKPKLMLAFEAHSVTKELRAERGSKSALLGGSYGDLFSYVGFVDGTSPASEIKDFLEKTIQVDEKRTRKINNQGAWAVSVIIPDLEDFDSANGVAEMYWIKGWSFVSQIEKGIPGVARYINLQGKGRSKGGIQSPVDISDKSKEGRDKLQQPQAKYMSELLDNFVRNLR